MRLFYTGIPKVNLSKNPHTSNRTFKLLHTIKPLHRVPFQKIFFYYNTTDNNDTWEKIMQTTVYYTAEDRYLINAVEDKGGKERKSKSAVILSILEEYFMGKNLGEILCEIGCINNKELSKSLEVQQKEGKNKLLGEILLNENFITEEDLNRALFLQKKTKYQKQKTSN